MLETSEERIKLLKAGFIGSEVEKLYLILNSFEVVGVDWQEMERETVGAVTKFACCFTHLVSEVKVNRSSVSFDPSFQHADVLAAPEVRA